MLVVDLKNYIIFADIHQYDDRRRGGRVVMQQPAKLSTSNRCLGSSPSLSAK